MEGFLMLVVLAVLYVSICYIIGACAKLIWGFYTPKLRRYEPDKIAKFSPLQFKWREFDLRETPDQHVAALRPEHLEVLAHRTWAYELQGRISDEVMLKLSKKALQTFLPGMEDLSKLLAICKRFKTLAQEGSEAAKERCEWAKEVLSGEVQYAKQVFPGWQKQTGEKKGKADKRQVDIEAADSFLGVA